MSRPVIHDASRITLGKFGGPHVWCSCGWPRVDEKCRLRSRGDLSSLASAERAVFTHLREHDPARAHRYALEKGIQP